MSFKERERLFILEYLKDLNASQACLRAGYRKRTTGCELLKRKEIAAAIQKEMDRRAKKLEITADKVLESIERIAAAAEAQEEYPSALKGYELLGKHLKLFTDKVEHTGSVGIQLIDEFLE